MLCHQVFKVLAGFVLGAFLLIACNSDPQLQSQTTVAPYLNLDEFTGLQNLGDAVAAIQLDYALDTVSGGELPLNSCSTVNATEEADVDPSQSHLLQLIKLNCVAASYYFAALKAGKVRSEFPVAINDTFVKRLPGQSVPDLGGRLNVKPQRLPGGGRAWLKSGCGYRYVCRGGVGRRFGSELCGDGSRGF